MEIPLVLRRLDEFHHLFKNPTTTLPDLLDWWKAHSHEIPYEELKMYYAYSPLWFGLFSNGIYSWIDSKRRLLFKGFVTFLVKECSISLYCENDDGQSFFEVVLQEQGNKNYYISSDLDVQKQTQDEWELVDFIASLGFNFNEPRRFYSWEFDPRARYCSLSTRSHARILDAGARVPIRWKHWPVHFGARFIYSMWEARQECKAGCIALIGILRIRRTDLRQYVARDLVTLIAQLLWSQRWNEFSLQ